MKFLSSQVSCPRAWSKGNGCQEKTAMGWFPWPCPLLVIYRISNFRFCAEHFLHCMPEPWWCFFSFSWNGSATFRKRDFLLSSTQKKIKMQVILLQIPETPTFGDIPELGWKGHPGIRSWCHKNQCFLGTSLEKKTQTKHRAEHWVRHVGIYQGTVPGTRGRSWHGYAGAEQGLCGLRQEVQVGSIFCVTCTARKWQKVDFSKLPKEPFVPLLSKFMKVKQPNP